MNKEKLARAKQLFEKEEIDFSYIWCCDYYSYLEDFKNPRLIEEEYNFLKMFVLDLMWEEENKTLLKYNKKYKAYYNKANREEV